MRSNGPTLLALPPFRGLTRKLILLAAASFIFFLIFGLVSGRLTGTTIGLLVLVPLESSQAALAIRYVAVCA